MHGTVAMLRKTKRGQQCHNHCRQEKENKKIKINKFDSTYKKTNNNNNKTTTQSKLNER